MIAVLAALAPVFLVILSGQVLKRRTFVPDGFWVSAERITFYLLFPSLLITNIARANLGGLSVGPMLIGSLAAIVLVVGGAFLLRRPLHLDGPAFTSLLQSAIRPNVYVALAAAVALYGDSGLTLVSLCMAVIVPFVNAIAVVALVRYASPREQPVRWRQSIAPIIQNPLIVACFVGLLLNLLGIGSPPVVGPTLEILGRASLPMALLSVGAGLDLNAMRVAGRVVAVACGLKLVALPLLTYLSCRALGADALATAIAVVYASVPISVSAYVMARQMGGDAPVMAGTITASTLAAMASMPLILMTV
ncbi:MAG: AEC family transporter [Rhodospirillales bacterium]|nr:AEC family transporter [Rhodospirillales bacterium]